EGRGDGLQRRRYRFGRDGGAGHDEAGDGLPVPDRVREGDRPAHAVAYEERLPADEGDQSAQVLHEAVKAVDLRARAVRATVPAVVQRVDGVGLGGQALGDVVVEPAMTGGAVAGDIASA